MVKVRLIPTLLYKDFTLVKGVKFNSWRRVGDLIQAVKVYNLREVDELIFLDIAASLNNRQPDFRLVDDFADECFMPLTVGGGIKSVDDIKNLLLCGADKVAINSAAFRTPELIREGASRFGSQCIVVSIDAKVTTNGRYEVFINSGTKATGKDPVIFAREVESLGAGEILITSIDRDGTMAGYDIELVKSVSDAVSIPVIASGGAGSCQDVLSVVTQSKVLAVAASSLFQFTEITPLLVKSYLNKNGISVRI